MNTTDTTLASKVQALVDEDLLNAFWDAADFFKTEDLVLFYDTNKQVDPITVYERDKFLTAPGVPESLKNKFKEPANHASDMLKDDDAAFWLLAAFKEGQMASAAITANLKA
ncbi:MAG TPA: hypothetical protein VK949_01205 [Methylotenera sp.]|nr:hypothetical protein [Methylotenera sp.]